jgi:hypothetical protein
MISKRLRRRLKKSFLKVKAGLKYGKLLYSLHSNIEAIPEPSQKLKQEWAYLDSRSLDMFHKKYDQLTTKQKSKLIDTLHKGENNVKEE